MQKIMIMTTLKPDMRATVDSWGMEDGDLIYMEEEIGFSKSPSFRCWPTVLHAIGDGWKLMAPPVKDEHYSAKSAGYHWWLTKERS